MPRAPIKISPARPAILASDWQVAYVRARLEPDVQPADALRRYQPQAFIDAIEIARERGIPPSQQLRAAVRALDQQVTRALAGEARRRGLYGTARGLRMLPRLGEQFQAIDLEDVVEIAVPVRPKRPAPPGYKSLEDLHAQLPDWAEQEVLALWQAEYEPLLTQTVPRASALPSPPRTRRRASRRERIIRLQQDCLQRLLVPVRPLPDDHLQAWLPASLATRLHAQGIRTIHDLMVQISKPDWTNAVRGFGSTKAGVIEAWLRQHGLMPARTPPRYSAPTALLSVSPPSPAHPLNPAPETPDSTQLMAQAIAPFMTIPSLSGERGKHRAPRSMLRAQTDAEAVQAWLETLRSPNTVRAYRKEALRFLLWAVLERRQALSSLDVEDALAYLRFLRAIPHDWCCAPNERTTPQLSANWRPFDRPQLSERSIAYAATVLHRMYQWLGKVRHLAGNPFGGLGRAALQPQRLDPAQRHLPQALAERVIELAGQAPGLSALAGKRRQLLLALLFDTGVRRHEAAGLTFGRIAYLADARLDQPGTTRYELRVQGKGNKLRSVPLSPRLLRLLREDMQLRGLPPELGDPDLTETPVIARMRGRQAGCLSPEAIYLECKAALAQAAEALYAAGEGEDAALVARATTHWTRHSFGMHLVETAGLEVVQELLGHEDLNTTRTYARISALTRAAALVGAGIGSR